MEKKYLEIFFNNEMNNIIIKIKAEDVYSVEIEDGYIKVFSTEDNTLHCYNMNYVLHYHIPDEIFGKSL